MPRMTIDECIMVKQQVTLLAQLIIPLRLKEFVDQANYEEAIGPMLDPTRFRSNMEQLELVKNLAKAALRYQDELKEILPEETLAAITAAWEQKVEGNVSTTGTGGDS